MIGRRTTAIMGDVYHSVMSGWGPELRYRFFYVRDYPSKFCRMVEDSNLYRGVPSIDRLIMSIHTNEVSLPPWDNHPTAQASNNQMYLFRLAEDILQLREQIQEAFPRNIEDLDLLEQRLAIDGYIFRDGRLLKSEDASVNTEAEGKLLRVLYSWLKLGDVETTFHHLTLSENHYEAKRWGDSIAHARHFLENILEEVAAAHCLEASGSPLSDKIRKKAVAVREYLEDKGLLDVKECKALEYVYGLLSDKGGHPAIPDNTDARLLRNLALTFSQYVMHRYEEYLATENPPTT